MRNRELLPALLIVFILFVSGCEDSTKPQDQNPLVLELSNLTILQGKTFQPFFLGDLFAHEDNEEIEWTFRGNSEFMSS